MKSIDSDMHTVELALPDMYGNVLDGEIRHTAESAQLFAFGIVAVDIENTYQLTGEQLYSSIERVYSVFPN